ncbi:MAG TPA: hypothetical protein VFL67_04025, partial [Mycobacterium sp.]|nr:hypothetical protein [Mycobacterium sp.]
MTRNGRGSTGFGVRRRYAALCAVALAATTIATGASAGAWPGDPPPPPSDSDLIRPLPVVTPVASGWEPKFPFPYDQTRDSVTGADITAMREMCQWFNGQYAT